MLWNAVLRADLGQLRAVASDLIECHPPARTRAWRGHGHDASESPRPVPAPMWGSRTAAIVLTGHDGGDAEQVWRDGAV